MGHWSLGKRLLTGDVKLVPAGWQQTYKSPASRLVGDTSIKILLSGHLSRRLTRWAYSIPMVRRPSVVVVHTFKLQYLWSQLANLDQILCVASLVSMATEIPHWLIIGKTMSPPFLGCFRSDPFVLAGNKDMHKISDAFEFRSDRTIDYGVSCPWASIQFPIDL